MAISFLFMQQSLDEAELNGGVVTFNASVDAQ
jgi:hypothetical protein